MKRNSISSNSSTSSTHSKIKTKGIKLDHETLFLDEEPAADPRDMLALTKSVFICNLAEKYKQKCIDYDKLQNEYQHLQTLYLKSST